ncbi:TRAP dicarboxylate transporter subunit DctM [Roseibium algicola]|jgi:tripartite ATP-independent transporter DctM subunit|uniref:TRAP transporter large permease protein n=1 Tax=Roseibium algicola TaxID=2857014 RepID=A0ABM6I2J0_9HYPH|nr:MULTISPECIES: TRAP transporter large permease subunit [Stappiaceae]AMN51421.1 TRAP dicarboxylate transporter subunit DctM [Labrenzia sp. CP4]AQQ04472.1 TRAP dicarboxylate transporter subunit DctM [Roseibium aggregatum]MBN8184777.1 TRAP transporter large permease subunit [Roseibium aggregatum]UES38238.1 TRAP transporter large permease subunit [Roseibium aggregatum]UES42542.1 TRAP transporter large permease subunit [Roseibium aggregatum]
MSSEFVLAIMFASLVGLLLTGLPLAFTLGALALVFTLTLWGPAALSVTVLNLYSTMTSESLLAIPLYVMMASILQRSGVIESLYRAMELWSRRLPGGLAVGTIAICTIIAAMTGIVGAAVAAMGMLALPSMLKRKYSPELAIGTICAGGTLGILIPPSVITIVYAVTAQASIGQMFIAGVVPGLLLASLYIGYIVLRSALNPSIAPRPDNDAPATWEERIASLKSLILPLLIIVGVLGTIYMGIATPTEAAAVGVFLAFLSSLIERRFGWELISGVALDVVKVTAMILWITIGARAFVAIFTGTGGADFLLSFIQDLDANRWIVLAIMLGILFFLGMFLDEMGIILLCVPVFLPVIDFLEFDRLWFGILFLVSAQMAYISPPFGYTLFYMKGVLPAGIGMGTVYRAIVPFILLQAIGIFICALFPELVLWLPQSMIN